MDYTNQWTRDAAVSAMATVGAIDCATTEEDIRHFMRNTPPEEIERAIGYEPA